MKGSQLENVKTSRPRGEQLKLDEVKALIATWRRENPEPGIRRMPEERWREVVLLAQAGSPGEVIRELELKPSNFYRRVRQEATPVKRRQCARVKKAPAEVQFNRLEGLTALGGGSVDRAPVELVFERAQGGRIQLSYPEGRPEELALILEQLLKAA